MNTFLDMKADEYPEAVMKQLHSIIMPSAPHDVLEFARLASTLTTIFNSPSEIRPAEIAQFINNSPLHDYAPKGVDGSFKNMVSFLHQKRRGGEWDINGWTSNSQAEIFNAPRGFISPKVYKALR